MFSWPWTSIKGFQYTEVIQISRHNPTTIQSIQRPPTLFTSKAITSQLCAHMALHEIYTPQNDRLLRAMSRYLTSQEVELHDWLEELLKAGGVVYSQYPLWMGEEMGIVWESDLILRHFNAAYESTTRWPELPGMPREVQLENWPLNQFCEVTGPRALRFVELARSIPLILSRIPNSAETFDLILSVFVLGGVFFKTIDSMDWCIHIVEKLVEIALELNVADKTIEDSVRNMVDRVSWWLIVFQLRTAKLRVEEQMEQEEYKSKAVHQLTQAYRAINRCFVRLLQIPDLGSPKKTNEATLLSELEHVVIRTVKFSAKYEESEELMCHAMELLMNVMATFQDPKQKHFAATSLTKEILEQLQEEHNRCSPLSLLVNFYGALQVQGLEQPSLFALATKSILLSLQPAKFENIEQLPLPLVMKNHLRSLLGKIHP